MGKLKIFLLLFCVTCWLLPFNLLELKEQGSDALPKGCQLSCSPARILLEPIVGPAQYLFSLKDHKLQAGAIFFWIIAVVAISATIRQKEWTWTLFALLRACFWTISLMCFLIILPLPGEKLVVNDKSWIIFDPHSHTYYSHDGIFSPQNNIAFHESCGFDCFFVTEHNNINSYHEFSSKDRLHTVFPGIEIVSADGFRILILADRNFDKSKFLHKKLGTITSVAHQNGFIVICPHCLKKKQLLWQQAVMQGVDGFEIFDSGDMGVFTSKRKALVRLCKLYRLIMVGGTDNHGWSTLTNVWTLIKKPQDVAITAKNILMLLKKRPVIRVVSLVQSSSWLDRLFIIAPLTATILYFCSLSSMQWISWIGWVLILTCLLRRIGCQRCLQIIIWIMAVYSVLYSGRLCWIQTVLNPGSSILIKNLALPLLILSSMWFIILLRPKGHAPKLRASY